MRNLGRDLNIGRQVDTTLKDIHNKLIDVENKVNDAKNGIDETVEVLRQNKTVSELILGEEVEEA